MRLLFDNGGRTGMLDIEAASVCISLWEYDTGALRVDANGERFLLRSADELRQEIKAIGVEAERLMREDMLLPQPLFELRIKHGKSLWLEAESQVTARLLAASVPKAEAQSKSSKAL